MGSYSIKDIEKLSGVKAHTIRIWEKRYNLLAPNRTNTNIRSYSDEDLKKMLNISTLYQNGYKISKIAELSSEELKGQVARFTQSEHNKDHYINQFIVAMIELNEIKFSDVINYLIAKFGLEETMLTYINYFLYKIGILWQTGSINPAQEHFISNLIRQKLIAAIDLSPTTDNAHEKKVLLYLPENELHEINLLLCYYLIKTMGYRGIYLGQSVPFQDLLEVNAIQSPDCIVTAFTNPYPKKKIDAYVRNIAQKFSDKIIFIGGSQVKEKIKELPENVKIIVSIDELKSKISKLVPNMT